MEKITEAGALYAIENSGITTYNIFTKAGFYRGGKAYHADKFVHIISGSCKLIIEKAGKDVSKTLTPASGIVRIKNGTPNLFYYSEDTLMLEWFPTGTKIEKFERYREMKKK